MREDGSPRSLPRIMPNGPTADPGSLTPPSPRFDPGPQASPAAGITPAAHCRWDGVDDQFV
jgi:hypothetical protein